MKKEYDGHSKKSGVYRITNTINGKIYIGSCKCFQVRANQHLSSLKINKHSNKHLQASFNKHGTDAFLFEVIEVVEGNKTARTTREQFYIDQELENWEKCYNFMKKAIEGDRSCWSKTPKKSSRLLSEAGKRRCVDPKVRERMREIGRDIWRNKTKEEQKRIIERMAEAVRGSSHSKQHKRRISNALKGHEVSLETREKLRQKNIGKKLSESTRKKMSQSRMGVLNCNAKVYKNVNLLSPDGEVYQDIVCLSVFARKHNLCVSKLCLLLKGRRKSHKGWRLQALQEEINE